MIDNERRPATVTASEVAAWVYCPESFRLSALGHRSENRPRQEAGIQYHRKMVKVERRTNFVTTRNQRGTGCVLSVAILFVAALALVARTVL